MFHRRMGVAIIIFACLATVQALADIATTAKHGLLMDAQSGQVL